MYYDLAHNMRLAGYEKVNTMVEVIVEICGDEEA